MRVFLTGATGYVGSNLALQLLKNPEIEELTLLIRSAEKGRILLQDLHSFQDRINLVFGDLAYAASLPLDYDAIIHAAAVRIPESNKNPEIAVQTNLLSTLDFIQQAQRSGVGRFIFLSTQAIYDFKNNTLPVGECGLVKPEGIYAFTKFTVEQWLHNRLPPNSMSWVILRLSRVYGLGFNTAWDQLVHKFCLESARGNNIKVWNSSNEYDFIHVKDVSSFIVNILSQPANNWNQIYNVGGGEICNVEHLVEVCFSEAHKLGLPPADVTHLQSLVDNEQHCFLDISKAREKLYWTPRVALSDGVRELIGEAVFRQI